MARSLMACGGRRGVARAKPARFSLDATGTATVGDAHTGEALSSEAFSQLSISDRVGSIPRRLDFADGSSFETRDNDGIDRLLKPYRGPRSGLIHELERFRPRLIVFVVLVVAFSVAIYRLRCRCWSRSRCWRRRRSCRN